MKFQRTHLLFLVAVSITLGAAFPRWVAAHEAKCPFCELDVVQDTSQQDNEAALRYGRKRIEYRCVMCAIADAKNYSGNLTVIAPTEIKGKPALLHRENGVWRSDPDNLVFIAEKVKHRHCQVGYRALTTLAAFETYAKANKVIVKDAKPVTLTDMVQIAESYAKN